MVFDTGASLGTFTLDSAYCSHHPQITKGLVPDYDDVPAGSAWTANRYKAVVYLTQQSVCIGQTNLRYKHLKVFDFKGYFNNTSLDGIFSIPKDDSSNVWELNFENNYLQVHSSDDFVLPENCFIAPMMINEIRNNPFVIQMPLEITFPDGETLILNKKFFIDSGMPWDIALMSNAEELKELEKRKDAVWMQNSYGLFKYYTVEGKLADYFNLDSLRVYTIHHQNNVPCDYLLGQNFLKRFNVFFDMKNKQVAFQPIDNFERLVNPQVRRFHMSTTSTHEGKIIVDVVADYEANYYKTAGFMKGDVIVKVNGIGVQDVSHEQKLNLNRQDSIIFDIVRGELPMKIVVYPDKDELSGD
jgi:hypothetical protein